MSFALAAIMIIFGAATFASDTGVAQQLIIGGVALISIILTAYTAFATYEDVKINGGKIINKKDDILEMLHDEMEQ